MNTSLTQAGNPAPRNASLLGALTLLLAFALGGVGASSSSAASATGQQLVSADLGFSPLPADIDTPFDAAVAVVIAPAAVTDYRHEVPQTYPLAQPALISATVFLARAPPIHS